MGLANLLGPFVVSVCGDSAAEDSVHVVESTTEARALAAKIIAEYDGRWRTGVVITVTSPEYVDEGGQRKLRSDGLVAIYRGSVP